MNLPHQAARLSEQIAGGRGDEIAPVIFLNISGSVWGVAGRWPRVTRSAAAWWPVAGPAASSGAGWWQMAARGSFAGLLLLCECDWLTGRTPPKTSFEERLPSGAGGEGEKKKKRISLGFTQPRTTAFFLLLTWLSWSGISRSNRSPVITVTDVLLDRGLNLVISLQRQWFWVIFGGNITYWTCQQRSRSYLTWAALSFKKKCSSTALLWWAGLLSKYFCSKKRITVHECALMFVTRPCFQTRFQRSRFDCGSRDHWENPSFDTSQKWTGESGGNVSLNRFGKEPLPSLLSHQHTARVSVTRERGITERLVVNAHDLHASVMWKSLRP